MTSKNLKIALFIPCYNVENTVVDVLEKITPALLQHLDKILLFDNASEDQSAEIIKKYLIKRNDPKFILYRNQANYSLGGSSILAFAKAIEMQLDYLICLHSDGQASPADVELIVKELQQDEYDFVFGSRFLERSETSGYSLLRKMGNYFFIRIQQQLVRAPVRDIGSMIAFRVATVAKLPYAKISSGMSYQPYLILSAFKLLPKVRWKEIAISWGPVQQSHVNVWSYGISYLRQLIKFRIFGPQVSEDRLERMQTTVLFVKNKN